MPLGMTLGLSPGDSVLNGDPASLHTKGVEPPPQFLAYFYCGQTAGCIKMPHGVEVGPDLPSLPHLAGDSRILDSISCSPPHRQNLPHFTNKPVSIQSNCKNSTQNAPKLVFLTSKVDKFSGEGQSPLPRPHPQWGEEQLAPRCQRLRHLGLAVKTCFPLACFQTLTAL